MLVLLSWHENYKIWLKGFDFSANTVALLYNSSIIIITVLFSFFAYKIGKWLIYSIAKRINVKKKFRIITSLYNNKFFSYLSYYFSFFIIQYSTSILIPTHNNDYVFIGKLYLVLGIILFLLIINSILNSFVELNQYKETNKSKPIKGLVQFLQIAIFFFGGIVCLSVLISDSPLKLIGGLGAASAIIMLIFKDSITGLVGGVQLSLNKTIVIGDWISLPKYDADGEVIDITLTAIKVRNWDNSISTIPSYNLIVADSIKNWQNMKESGVRRISCSINIDMTTISFCNAEMLDNYYKIEGVKEALQKIITVDETVVNIEKITGKNLTNLGVFRAYVYFYLEKKKEIRKDKDLIVKQKHPTSNGLSFEIYCFANTTITKEYETIQADILDHVLSILPYFDLKVYQVQITTASQKMN